MLQQQAPDNLYTILMPCSQTWSFHDTLVFLCSSGFKCPRDTDSKSFDRQHYSHSVHSYQSEKKLYNIYWRDECIVMWLTYILNFDSFSLFRASSTILNCKPVRLFITFVCNGSELRSWQKCRILRIVPCTGSGKQQATNIKNQYICILHKWGAPYFKTI
jgi:hypothetical protein